MPLQREEIARDYQRVAPKSILKNSEEENEVGWLYNG